MKYLYIVMFINFLYKIILHKYVHLCNCCQLWRKSEPFQEYKISLVTLNAKLLLDTKVVLSIYHIFFAREHAHLFPFRHTICFASKVTK